MQYQFAMIIPHILKLSVIRSFFRAVVQVNKSTLCGLLLWFFLFFIFFIGNKTFIEKTEHHVHDGKYSE